MAQRGGTPVIVHVPSDTGRRRGRVCCVELVGFLDPIDFMGQIMLEKVKKVP
jgi:hypothetical protein